MQLLLALATATWGREVGHTHSRVSLEILTWPHLTVSNLQMLVRQAGFLEYIVDRRTEGAHSGKVAKYSIVQVCDNTYLTSTLAMCPL